jgi:hypothetical protein
MENAKFNFLRECYSCAAKVGAFMVVLAIASYFVDGLTSAGASLLSFLSAATTVVDHYVSIVSHYVSEVAGCKYVLIPLSAISLWSSCLIVKVGSQEVDGGVIAKLLSATLISTICYGLCFLNVDDVNPGVNILIVLILIAMLLAAAVAIICCENGSFERYHREKEKQESLVGVGVYGNKTP